MSVYTCIHTYKNIVINKMQNYAQFGKKCMATCFIDLTKFINIVKTKICWNNKNLINEKKNNYDVWSIWNNHKVQHF